MAFPKNRYRKQAAPSLKQGTACRYTLICIYNSNFSSAIRCASVAAAVLAFVKSRIKGIEIPAVQSILNNAQGLAEAGSIKQL